MQHDPWSTFGQKDRCYQLELAGVLGASGGCNEALADVLWGERPLAASCPRRDLLDLDPVQRISSEELRKDYSYTVLHRTVHRKSAS